MHQLAEAGNAVQQHGPYGIMEGEKQDWYLIYFDDDESIESWDAMLTAHPQFGRSHQLESITVEIDDRNLVIERWGQQALARMVVGA